MRALEVYKIFGEGERLSCVTRRTLDIFKLETGISISILIIDGDVKIAQNILHMLSAHPEHRGLFLEILQTVIAERQKECDNHPQMHGVKAGLEAAKKLEQLIQSDTKLAYVPKCVIKVKSNE